MFEKIIKILPSAALTVFLGVLTYCAWDLTQYIKIKTDQVVGLAQDTSNKTLSQVTDLRHDTFDYLHQSNSQIMGYLYATNNQLDARVGKIQTSLMDRVDVISQNTNDQLTHVNKTLDTMAQKYSVIPEKVGMLADRVDVQTNCDINEQCWQNMTTDIMIDTRNVMRDGSKTFRIVNDKVPIVVADIETISNTIAQTLPPTAQSVQQTADHIQQVTKPHWYDRFLNGAIGGGLLYFKSR